MLNSPSPSQSGLTMRWVRHLLWMMVREGAKRGADDVLRVSGVEMRVNGSSNKYGALRCELLYSVVNSGSSFRHKRRMPGREQVAATKERERRGVVFCIFSRGSKKNGGHLHQIFYFTSAAYRMPEQTRPG